MYIYTYIYIYICISRVKALNPKSTQGIEPSSVNMPDRCYLSGTRNLLSWFKGLDILGIFWGLPKSLTPWTPSRNPNVKQLRTLNPKPLGFIWVTV